MFIQEQMATVNELNFDMQDFVNEVAAQLTPITAHMTGAGMQSYLIQIAQWYDTINCLLSV